MLTGEQDTHAKTFANINEGVEQFVVGESFGDRHHRGDLESRPIPRVIPIALMPHRDERRYALPCIANDGIESAARPPDACPKLLFAPCTNGHRLAKIREVRAHALT